MIGNPYEVLGISTSATNDEIKKAYRELSRKYHPDAHMNNPLSNLAEEKFKVVQEAYEQIMKERESSYSQGGYNQSGYGYNQGNNSQGYYSSGTEQESPEMEEVRIQVVAKKYQAALNLLSRTSERTARWYYYSALANAGNGNNIEAFNHAKQAAAMEPNNKDYANLVNQLSWRSQRYQNTSYNNGRPGYGHGSGDLCCNLLCADALCECMGGDLISCC